MARRFFKHGELPLLLLTLLLQRPMHGYELMAELGRLFEPDYTPSPGSVYPAIDALEAEGLIVGDDSTGKTTYEITEVGRSAVAKRTHVLAAIELRTGKRLRPNEAAEAALERFVVRVRPFAGAVPAETLDEIFEQTVSRIEELSKQNENATQGGH